LLEADHTENAKWSEAFKKGLSAAPAKAIRMENMNVLVHDCTPMFFILDSLGRLSRKTRAPLLVSQLEGHVGGKLYLIVGCRQPFVGARRQRETQAGIVLDATMPPTNNKEPPPLSSSSNSYSSLPFSRGEYGPSVRQREDPQMDDDHKKSYVRRSEKSEMSFDFRFDCRKEM
jgi:hypothetical protein